MLKRHVVAVDRGHLEQAEDDHEEHGRAERELDCGLTSLAAQAVHAPFRCTRMSSETLMVPEVTATPKRLSVYGALTVARTLPPAVQTPTAAIETVMPGTL